MGWISRTKTLVKIRSTFPNTYSIILNKIVNNVKILLNFDPLHHSTHLAFIVKANPATENKKRRMS